jgi:hypothetical protein
VQAPTPTREALAKHMSLFAFIRTKLAPVARAAHSATTRLPDAAPGIDPSRFSALPGGKRKLNWFAFELACEIRQAIKPPLARTLAKQGYDRARLDRSCMALAIGLQGVVLKKLRGEIPQMEIGWEQIEAAFPGLNDKTVERLVNCTGTAWERLLSVCVTCPSACVTNKDDHCPMFDDPSYADS